MALERLSRAHAPLVEDKVPFLAPKSGDSQPPVVLVPEDLMHIQCIQELANIHKVNRNNLFKKTRAACNPTTWAVTAKGLQVEGHC